MKFSFNPALGWPSAPPVISTLGVIIEAITMGEVIVKSVFMLIVAAGLSACALTVPIEEAKRGDFGPTMSGPEAIEKTRMYFERVLIDPDSLKLQCSEDVRKGWARRNMFDEPTYGYLVRCLVNAKNSFGGYTGNKDYAVVVNGSSVFTVEVNKNYNMQSKPERWMGYAE